MGDVSGLSLALFTGLAPAGAVAYCAVALVLLACRSMEEDARLRLTKLLGVPLAICWLGFFAAATHLGSAGNALYAFSGIGRSPLSNEVAAVVAFLFCAGITWLYSFKRNPNWTVCACGLAASALCGIALVAFVGLAYDVSTVPTWTTVLTPVNILVGALCAGLSLASVVVHGCQVGLPSVQRVLLVLAALALAGSCAGQLAFVGHLNAIGNNVVALGTLGAGHERAVLAAAALGLAGLVLQMTSRTKPERFGASVALDAAGAVLVLAAALVLRFPFYDAYLSVGF